LLGIRRKLFTIYSIVFFGITLFGIFISGGRTALLSYILLYILAYILIKKSNGLIFILIIFLGVFSFISFNGITNNNTLSRFADSKDDFKVGRYDRWVIGSRIFMDSPFIGCGAGNLNIAIQEKEHFLDSLVSKFKGGHVESDYFSILATYGIVGFILYYKIFFNSIKLLILRKFFFQSQFNVSLIFGFGIILINMVTNPAIIIDIRMGLILFMLFVLPVGLLKVTK
jgi:hypothetical protein